MNFLKRNISLKLIAHWLLLTAYCSLLTAVISCQPKANYTTVNQPLTHFIENTNDSVRGAKSLEDVSCYFFLALKGNLRFDQLARFIPDSADIVQIYTLTNTPADGQYIKTLADTIHEEQQSSFYYTVTEAKQVNGSWVNATFEKLMIEEIPDQKLPSKKITLECKSGDVTLRASAKCLQIGSRWFIGEDIKFGV